MIVGECTKTCRVASRALRGRRIGDDQLTLDFHEVGEPFYFDVELTFEGDRIEGMFTWQPVGWPITVQGSR